MSDKETCRKCRKRRPCADMLGKSYCMACLEALLEVCGEDEYDTDEDAGKKAVISDEIGRAMAWLAEKAKPAEEENPQ